MDKKQNGWYSWAVVGILMLAYIFSFVDRYVVNLLVEPMKRDLGLNDTQVSLLIGASFALFYATLGVPLGRLADTRNRRKLVAAGVALWSLMTAACGLAQSYWQLFAARMGVGVGEASLSPSAYSLITDYFPKDRLATALSVYSVGIYLGTGLAYLLGGQLLQWVGPWGVLPVPLLGKVYSWQLVFVLVGLPGLLVALLVLLIREPERKHLLKQGTALPLGQALGQLRGGAFWYLCIGSAFFCTVSYGAGVWLPTYLMRLHGLGVAEAGNFVGLLSMLGAPVGVVLGGHLADTLARRQVAGAKIKFCLWSALLWIPFNVLYVNMPSLALTQAALVPFIVLLSCNVGVTVAAVQEIAPAPVRSFASALLLLCQNLLGLGLGPTTVALLNDYVFGSPLALGKSLAMSAVAALLLAALFFGLALRKHGRTA